MKIDSSTPVLVLGFGHGGLGIARSLGRLGIPVYAAHSRPDAPALASRYCRAAFEWDFSEADDGESIEFLLRAGKRLGAQTLLIPTSDNLSLLVARHAEILGTRFTFQRQDPELVRQLCDKRELFHLARRLRVPTPNTVFPSSRNDVLTFLENSTLPVVLKGVDGLRLEALTGLKMVIAHTPDELLDWYGRLDVDEQPNLMLQEYIPGGDDTIWMFNGYFDQDSRTVLGFTGKKLRQHPIHRGSTSLGICLQNQKVFHLTSYFVKEIGYRGILDIGFRYDQRDGTYKLLDPNPRIGSTFRLFVATNGMDVVRALYLDLTGQPVPASTLREGRKWLVEDQDLESALDYAAEGSLTLWQWLKSMRGVEECAWFAADDPVPAWKVARGLAGRGLRRQFRAVRLPRRRPRSLSASSSARS